MRKKILMLTLAVCMLFTASAHASGAVPGSPADPLVSQSYVDERINDLHDEILNLIGDDTGTRTVQLNDWQLEVIVEEVIRNLGGQGQHSMIFQAVHLLPGQRLMGGEGAELVLRSGIAHAIVPGVNGLANLTIGVDIMANQQIQHNHHLVIPRADGRGIRAHTEIWVMVKGPYSIMN